MPTMAAPVTDLAQQLAQRAVRHGVDQGKRHPGKASLLYTFQEAADIDAETIYRIGVEGESFRGSVSRAGMSSDCVCVGSCRRCRSPCRRRQQRASSPRSCRAAR